MIDFFKNNNSEAFNVWHEANCANTILLSGQHFQNQFITHFNLVNIDFSASLIEDCYFKNVQFWASNFTKVQFKNCYFVSCHFGVPELINANSYLTNFLFQPPIFSDTQFLNCFMLNINFREIDLKNSHFEEGVMEKCDMRNAALSNATFNEVKSLHNLL